MKEKRKTKVNLKRNFRKQKGITLIALIITIVILIILATITINIAFGDNGLIKRAQDARDLYANESASELDVLNEVDEYLKDQITKTTKPDTPVEPEIPYTNVYVTLYEDGTLGFSNDDSKIEGLTPKDGKTWEITDMTFSGTFIPDEDATATTPWFDDRESITRVEFVNEVVPKSVTVLFMGCANLTEIVGLENLNTTNVSNMSGMFCDCNSLEHIDVSVLKTKNVTDMSYMFAGWNDYNIFTIEGLDSPNFDTSNVTDMNTMFSTNSDIENIEFGENFDTSNVTNMESMFTHCEALTNLDVSMFNTSKVEDMSFMFCACFSLETINVSSFDTSNVKDMQNMFGSYYSEAPLREIIGLENFDTHNVTDMGGMFKRMC